jgi:choline dehydrogenase-like flavoprotein
MTAPRICDVLIIGAGATGALAALVLGRAGLDVVCLEQGSRRAPSNIICRTTAMPRASIAHPPGT